KLLGRPDAAKGSLSRALQLDPQLDLANLAMGHLLAGGGQWEQAVTFLDKYARARPDDAEVRLTLGQLYLEHSRLHEAAAALGQAAKLRPNDKRVHYVLGRLYSASGQPELAAKEFERFSTLEAA